MPSGWDASDIRKMQNDLAGAGARAGAEVGRSMFKAGLNIKRDLQGEATRTRSFRGVGASLDFALTESPATVDVDVGTRLSGPRAGPPGRRARGAKPRGPGVGQGSLGWIAYHGTGRTPPQLPDPQGALDREVRGLVGYLAAAGVTSVWR